MVTRGGAFRNSVFSPDLGCTLSTRIEMFNFEKGHPNVLMPGQTSSYDASELHGA